MKKLILIGCLATLAACGVDDTLSAKKDCNRLNYAKGTPEYEHCVVDMKKANELQDRNKANMK